MDRNLFLAFALSFGLGGREAAGKLNQYFSRGELNTLAFDLGIDYQNIPGETKQERARELVLYCQRNGLLDGLLAEARRQRPHVDW